MKVRTLGRKVLALAVGAMGRRGEREGAAARLYVAERLEERVVLSGVSFAPQVYYTVGGPSSSVAVGDFNGDGRNDLVTANFTSGTVSVLLGVGNGTFGANAEDYVVGSGPFSVAVGDFNGDGKADLVAANYDSNTVSVLLGSGNGTFGANVDYEVGSGPSSVAVGDFNGDGKTDLVAANLDSDTVSVLLGNGNGTFATKVDYAVGSAPISVAVGDFNGDGKTDLVTASYVSTGTVSVLLGAGNGTFAAKVDYAAGFAPISVAVGDFNGDSKTDLVAANSTFSGTVSVLLGVGNGTFAAKVDCAVGSYPSSVAVGDFNGDSKTDLVTANSDSNTVSVLLGNGNGTFAAKVDCAVGPSPTSVAVGDFNGDGKTDLVTANINSYEVSVLINQYLPDWVDGTATATWNPATKTLTVTGAAKIIADPGVDGLKIVGTTAAASARVGPLTPDTTVHLGTVTLSGGASIQFNSSAQLTSLSLSGATATVSVGRSVVLDLSSLSIDATAKLDLGDGSAVVRSGNLGTISGLVGRGLNADTGPLWTGTGITSSLAATDTKFAHAVGAIVNTYEGAAIYSTFRSLTVAGTDVLLAYTVFGDADLSGTVDDTDYFLTNNGYLNNKTGWLSGDFDYNGLVDDTDFFLLNNGYLNQ